MAIAMLAVVRAHALEPVFGGLDRAVRFHRILGPSAILLLIAHVIFLTLAEFQSGHFHRQRVHPVLVGVGAFDRYHRLLFAFAAWRPCL